MKIDLARFVATTQEEAAAVLGVSERSLQTYAKRGCPGEKGHYPIPAMLQWLRRNVWEIVSDPELGADGDSEGLERYRMARAQQEEIKLAKMRGDFIPREDVHTALIETSPILLSAGEQIKRAGGNDLGEILIAAWGEVLKRLESIFGNDRTGGEINGDGGAPA